MRSGGPAPASPGGPIGSGYGPFPPSIPARRRRRFQTATEFGDIKPCTIDPGYKCCAYPAATRPITVAGDVITFARGDSQCAQDPSYKKGTYRWRVSGGFLTFKVVRDNNCSLYVHLLTTGPWKRK